MPQGRNTAMRDRHPQHADGDTAAHRGLAQEEKAALSSYLPTP